MLIKPFNLKRLEFLKQNAGKQFIACGSDTALMFNDMVKSLWRDSYGGGQTLVWVEPS